MRFNSASVQIEVEYIALWDTVGLLLAYIYIKGEFRYCAVNVMCKQYISTEESVVESAAAWPQPASASPNNKQNAAA